MRKTISFALSLAAISMGGVAWASPPSSADIAAGNEAMRAFMAQRQSCGDKIVTALDVTPQSGGFAPALGPQSGPYTIYNEAVNVERRIGGQGGNLNDADRLNGLQWKGRVQLVAKAAREIRVPRGGGGGGPTATWSQWQANVTLASVDVELRNGLWYTNVQVPQIAAFGRFGQLRRVACSEVPG